MENGAYGEEGVIWHTHSNKLMVEMLKLFPKKVPVIDLGCGHNWYVTVFDYLGYDAVGVDAVDLKSKLFIKHDITKPIYISVNDGAEYLVWSKDPEELIPYKHNVISLEVGEHIPSHLSIGYLDNVCRFNGDIIMSWALPDQPGIGHINCQPLEWVTEKMKLRGYHLEFSKTHQLRNAVAGCHCSWFQNTLMYFTRP